MAHRVVTLLFVITKPHFKSTLVRSAAAGGQGMHALHYSFFNHLEFLAGIVIFFKGPQRTSITA